MRFDILTLFPEAVEPMAFPILYGNLLEGLRAADPALGQMARVYRLSRGRRFLYVYLPQLRPYLVSGCSTALGLSWKAGVAAEVIGVVSGSIGGKLYESKIYFLTADLFCWTLVIVLLSVLLEKAVLLLLKFGYGRLEAR